MASPPQRIPQLDGLRAIAVTAVLVSHTISEDTTLETLGTSGVRLFFVISGYLITRILLDHQQVPIRQLLKTFYLRRFLRIFPLYYFFLLITAVLAFPEWQESWPWYVTFTSNIQLLQFERWPAGRLNHLWSLAVEEQFYLIWPWIIVFCPRSRLLTVLMVCILIGPLFRVIGYGSTLHFGIWYQTPANADLLGMGALLAYFHQQGTTLPTGRKNLLLIGITLGLTVFLQASEFRYQWPHSIYFTMQPLVEGLLDVLLVDRATRSRSDLWGRLLASRPMTYVGMISYGIYLWHGLLVPNPFLPYGVGLFVAVMITSILIASFSWYCLEKPLNTLRHQFPYAGTERKPLRPDN